MQVQLHRVTHPVSVPHIVDHGLNGAIATVQGVGQQPSDSLVLGEGQVRTVVEEKPVAGGEGGGVSAGVVAGVEAHRRLAGLPQRVCCTHRRHP